MGVRETDVRIGQLANRIRLTFLRDHLAEVLESVPEVRVTARDAISYALQKKANQRRSNHFKQALRAALFPWIRTLEAFDFSAQPSINSGVIWDLSNLEWIDAGESVSLFSSSGIGKTDPTIALGYMAVKRKYSVRFYDARVLLTYLLTVGRLRFIVRAM